MNDHKAAAVSAVLSGTTATSWLVTANAYVQLVAGIVAIISGMAAAYYYINKAQR